MLKENAMSIVIGALVVVLVGGGAIYMTRGVSSNHTAAVATATGTKTADTEESEPAETDAKSDAKIQNESQAPATAVAKSGANTPSAKSAAVATERTSTGFDNLIPIRTMDKNGVKVEVMHEGTGEALSKSGMMVAVHYIGKLTDGSVFDTSLRNGGKSDPFVFNLGAGQVIKGWDIGVEGMKVGEARRLTIPGDLAYGAAGAAGGKIPPNATLVFDVQLMGMK